MLIPLGALSMFVRKLSFRRPSIPTAATLISYRCMNIPPPTFFVSHRWSDRFRELVETLTAHCQASGAGDPQQIFLWIDIFAVNQHSGAAQAKDLENLGAAIMKSMKGTLLVMDLAGGVLTRIWCLYEIHKTVQERPGKEADLIMLMPKNIDVQAMQDVFAALDVEKAEATVLADRDRILADIRQSKVNPQLLNMKLKATLVKGAELQVDAARDTLRSSLMRCAHMVNFAGHAAQAKPLLEEAIEMQRKFQNHESDEQQLKLATAQHELGHVLDDLSMDSDALKSHERALEIRRRIHKSDHPDLASSMIKTGWALHCLKRCEEAETITKEGLAMCQRLYPSCNHIDVANSLGNLSSILKSVGRMDEGLLLLDQAMEITLRLKGPNLTYANGLHNKSRFLQHLGRAVDALPVLEQSLQILLRIFGSEIHPQVANGYSVLSDILHDAKLFEESVKASMKTLDIRRRALGTRHSDTARAAWDVSDYLAKLGRAREAILYVEEAKGMYVTLGQAKEVAICDARIERLEDVVWGSLELF